MKIFPKLLSLSAHEHNFDTKGMPSVLPLDNCSYKNDMIFLLSNLEIVNIPNLSCLINYPFISLNLAYKCNQQKLKRLYNRKRKLNIDFNFIRVY
jgi:hypothetical protein